MPDLHHVTPTKALTLIRMTLSSPLDLEGCACRFHMKLHLTEAYILDASPLVGVNASQRGSADEGRGMESAEVEGDGPPPRTAAMRPPAPALPSMPVMICPTSNHPRSCATETFPPSRTAARLLTMKAAA